MSTHRHRSRATAVLRNRFAVRASLSACSRLLGTSGTRDLLDVLQRHNGGIPRRINECTEQNAAARLHKSNLYERNRHFRRLSIYAELTPLYAGPCTPAPAYGFSP